MKRYLIVILLLISGHANADGAACVSRFINPISDICWSCLFPMTIGSATVVPSQYPDTNNPASPISFCPKPLQCSCKSV